MDARSLLRAKKAEARIEHPYASYNAAGVLRCSICAIPVKQWDAHLLTKQHRTSVIREKSIQAKQAQKRSAPESSSSTTSKRPKIEDPNHSEEEGEEEGGVRGLPAGFFSEGNQPAVQEDEEEEVIQEPTGDAELDDFFASLNDDSPAVFGNEPPVEVESTVSKPVKKKYLSTEMGIASYEAAPVRLLPPGESGTDGAGEEEVGEVETEEEKRERIRREEREEIMGRLEEEERAQEDADSRVVALKARMEALKRRKEARGGSKALSKQNATSNGA